MLLLFDLAVQSQSVAGNMGEHIAGVLFGGGIVGGIAKWAFNRALSQFDEVARKVNECEKDIAVVKQSVVDIRCPLPQCPMKYTGEDRRHSV